MPCPYLSKTHPPRCTAVAGEAALPPRIVVATLCRAGFKACPAHRFTRAAGRLLHPADFIAWVTLRIPTCYDDETPQQG
jgi:hypothetical protein